MRKKANKQRIMSMILPQHGWHFERHAMIPQSIKWLLPGAAGLPNCRTIGNGSSEELKHIMAWGGRSGVAVIKEKEEVLCFVNWH
jgi:hypothetical protein